MKLSKVIKAVDHLRDVAAEFPQDAERCRQLEMELWAQVLHDDATGKGSPAKSAAALETRVIKFDRWGGSF
jgi:hypothetical protein